MICTSSWPAASSAGADGADAAVHHVGGRDDVAAGLGLHQRLPHQHRERLVVEDRRRRASARRGRGWCRDRAPRRAARRSRGTAFLMARMARQTRFSGLNASLPSLVAQLRVGVGEQRDAGDAEGRRARLAHHVSRRSGGRRRASRRPARARPSATNIGQIRSSVVSTFSRTSRRDHLVRRLRRMRVARSSEGAGPVLGLGRDDAHAGFDRAAVFDGHDCRFLDAGLFYPVRAAPASRPSCR